MRGFRGPDTSFNRDFVFAIQCTALGVATAWRQASSCSVAVVHGRSDRATSQSVELGSWDGKEVFLGSLSTEKKLLGRRFPSWHGHGVCNSMQQLGWENREGSNDKGRWRKYKMLEESLFLMTSQRSSTLNSSTNKILIHTT